MSEAERAARLAVERMAGAEANVAFPKASSQEVKTAWLDGYWAACSLFAGNREEHDRLRDAFLDSLK